MKIKIPYNLYSPNYVSLDRFRSHLEQRYGMYSCAIHQCLSKIYNGL